MKRSLTKDKTQVLRVPEYLLNKNKNINKLQEEGLEKYGNASEIIKNKLYLGSYYNARDKIFLKKYNITDIINVAEEIDIQEQINIKTRKIIVYDEPSINHNNINDYLYDFINIIPIIENIIENDGSCFIHCKHGRSRSATVIIAYLIWKNNISYKEALEYIQNIRTLVKPNNYITKYTKELEQLIRNQEIL